MVGKGKAPGSPKTGGRKKGTMNKLSKAVIERLELLDCDPIEGMVRIAKLAEAGIEKTSKDGEQYIEPDLHLAGQMYKELANYVAPKRKAIEHSTEQGKELVIQWLPPQT